MKLILLQDVKDLGKKGAILEVADGYARNFLLPKRLAAPATEGVVRAKAKETADIASKKAREVEAARQWAAELEEGVIEVKVRVGEGGRLFGSITTQDVANAIRARFGREIDKRKVTIGDPIKSLGDHQVTLKVYPEVNARVHLKVVPQDA